MQGRDREGDVQRRTVGRQGVMVPAAREIQHVAGLHRHLLHQWPAGLFKPAPRGVVVGEVLDRIVRAARIQIPDLGSAGLDNDDVVVVEMRTEGLNAPERTVDVGTDAGSESPRQRFPDPHQRLVDGENVIGDQAGTGGQEHLDLLRPGPKDFALRRCDRVAVLVWRDRHIVPHQPQMGRRPKRPLTQQPVEVGPGENRGLGAVA